VRWVVALAPWAVSAAVCAGALHLPPSALRSRPLLRDGSPCTSPCPSLLAPEPPKPKGVRYEPWEKVPS
jgi:hypothetical protein